MKHKHGQKRDVALKALRHFTNQLMSLPNVVGVGLGKFSGSGREDDKEHYIIKIYVKKKPFSFFRKFDLNREIPPTLYFRPDNNSDNTVPIATEIEETGEFQLEKI